VDLAVSRWFSGGHDVLCVSDACDDREVGRYDRTTGRLSVGDQARVYEVVRALWAYLSGGPGEAAVERVPESVAEAAHENGGEPGDAGEVDDAGEVAEPGDAVEVAEPGDGGAVAGAARGMGAVGEELEASAVVELARVRGGGGKAGRIVDRRLGLLRRDGWAVLSSVGRAAGADIDRLVVGPPGVFAITVRRGDEVPQFLRSGVRGSRQDAQYAERMLSEDSGLPVRVTAILAFVGPAGDEVAGATGLRGTAGVADAARAAGAGDLLVARAEEIVEVLRDLPSVYSLDERYRIVDAARGAASWGPIAA
jgi:hypothetical protein